MEKITEKEFDKMYELLKLSFIDDELRPYDAQKALFQESIYHVYAHCEEKTNALKAFIAVWDFDAFVFVDYFAVHPVYRNQGLGERILRELSQMTSKPICLEIETPEDEISQRRQRFYERNHFVLCPFPYEQPPIARGNAPVALSLMSSHPIKDRELFESIRSTIYEFAYKRFN